MRRVTRYLERLNVMNADSALRSSFLALETNSKSEKCPFLAIFCLFLIGLARSDPINHPINL
jgi:hypothetical protein